MPRDPGSAAKLKLLGNDENRRILATINVEPYSVKQLAGVLDMSQPTIYRHLQQLEEHDLVSTRTFVSTNGHHYKIYKCNFRSAFITLDQDEYDAYFSKRDSEGLTFTQRCIDLYKSMME